VTNQPDESVYTKMNMLLLGNEIWKKYIVIDNKKMICSKCEFEVEDVISSPEEKPLVLLSHYHSRRNHSRRTLPSRSTSTSAKSNTTKHSDTANYKTREKASNISPKPVPRPSTSKIPVRSQVQRNILTPPSTRQRKEASDTSSGNHLVHHLRDFLEPHFIKDEETR